MTILVHEWVTGGGLAGSPLPRSWAVEGRAIRQAIATDFANAGRPGLRVIVTLDARLPDDPGPWTIERVGDDPGAHRLLELAPAADYTVLVAPETAGILAQQTRALQAAGARVLGSSTEAVDLCGDKFRLAAWLQAQGIATPRSRKIHPADGLPADTEYPAVLKPVDGAGSVDTFYLNDERSLPDEARRLPEALLQPYVRGEPMSASFLVDVHSRPWLIGIGLQHIVVRDGRFDYRGGSLPAPTRSAEPRIRRAVRSIPGLRGFVGVDFIWDARCHQATVLEINPRPTTSYVGLARLLPPGLLAEAWLAVFESESGLGVTLGDLAPLVHGGKRLSFEANGHWELVQGGAGG